MAAIQITIDMDGDGFQTDPDFHLRYVFNQIRAKLVHADLTAARTVFPVRNIDGDTVGKVEVEDDRVCTPRVDAIITRALAQSLRGRLA